MRHKIWNVLWRATEFVDRHTKAIFIGLLLVLTTANVVQGIAWNYLRGENQQRIIDLNDERYNNVVNDCLDQNLRHDNTVSRLDEIYNEAAKGMTKEEEKGLRAGQARTVFIIDSLVPVQPDCYEYANSKVTAK